MLHDFRKKEKTHLRQVKCYTDFLQTDLCQVKCYMAVLKNDLWQVKCYMAFVKTDLRQATCYMVFVELTCAGLYGFRDGDRENWLVSIQMLYGFREN